MTTRELTEKYLKAHGLRLLVGADGDLSPILPFLILDVQYQIFDKNIRPLKVRFEAKRIKKEWENHYRAFNRDFFECYTVDEADEIIDMMDRLEAYIHNEVEFVKISVMGCMRDFDLEAQVVLASAMVCNILCQTAQVVWGHCYKDKNYCDKKNPEIKAMTSCSYRFMNAVYKNTREVDCNDSTDVNNCVNALCRKIVRFLKEEG